MTRVALITTGKCEHRALHHALKRLFPEVEFESLPPDAPLNCFTSIEVRHLSDKNSPTNPDSSIRQLVATMVGAVIPGGIDDPFNFAFLIDDLELCNDGHPHEVVELVRKAVRSHVEQSKWSLAKQERVVEAVRDKCSCHLLRPMVEAYFFGDPAALARAKAARPPQLDPTCDFEQLLATDPEYLAVPDDNDKLKPHNGGTGDRARHPKSYLTFLCDPTLTRKRPYAETKEGTSALESLDWHAVIQSAALKCPFLSAFLEDLSWAVNAPLDWIAQEQTSELTRMKLDDPARVLRNI